MRNRRWVVLAVVLLIGAGFTFMVWPRHAPPPAAAGHGRGDGLPWSGQTARQLEDIGPVLARSVPVSVAVPALGIRAKVMRLGLAADGSMQTPPLFGEPPVAGWYQYSPTPGQPGPSVIAGHIDTFRGPSVFYRLAAARPGQEVDVGLADGVTAVFRVTVAAEYPKAAFPSRVVYGPVPGAGLRLITCGGSFDAAARSYRGSTVVFAVLTGSRPA